MKSNVLDYVPENLPPRAVTAEMVAWPPSDSSTAPWEAAHVTTADGEILFAEGNLNDTPYLDMVPQGSMSWSEVDAIVDTHFENGWRCVALLGETKDGGIRSVLVPWSHYLPQTGDDHDPESKEEPAIDPFLAALAQQIAEVAENPGVETIPGNLDLLCSFADHGGLRTLEL